MRRLRFGKRNRLDEGWRMSGGSARPSSIAVLTSGGDAGGMNPAVRAVVRSALHHGIDVYAVFEGYQGLVEGGELIRRFESSDVGGVLQKGGTLIGTGLWSGLAAMLLATAIWALVASSPTLSWK